MNHPMLLCPGHISPPRPLQYSRSSYDFVPGDEDSLAIMSNLQQSIPSPDDLAHLRLPVSALNHRCRSTPRGRSQ